MQALGDLRFRSVDLQSGHPSNGAVAGIWLDLDKGFSEPAEVRGADDVIPQASGQYPGVWIRHQRLITLVGHVRGSGSTYDERAASWREQTDTLMAVMGLYLAPGLLEVDGPYLGIA